MSIITIPMQGSTSAIDVPDLSRHCLDLACDSPTMHSSEHGLHVDQGDQLLFAFLITRRFSENDSKNKCISVKFTLSKVT